MARTHEINLFEIDVGNLAKEKGGSRCLWLLDARLAMDHQFFDSELRKIVQTQNVDLTADDNNIKERSNQKLASIKENHGSLFDGSFLSMMQFEDQDVMSLLTKLESSLPMNSDLRLLTRKTLPVLEQHHGYPIQTLELLAEKDESILKYAYSFCFF